MNKKAVLLAVIIPLTVCYLMEKEYQFPPNYFIRDRRRIGALPAQGWLWGCVEAGPEERPEGLLPPMPGF